MVKRIITISREFGSGGRFIGEEVAKKLGIAYYDKMANIEKIPASGTIITSCLRSEITSDSIPLFTA